jgi:biotin transport system substrate-specific component
MRVETTAITRDRSATALWTGVFMVAFALLTALAAQIYIPLGFTPVPVTLQVLTVLLAAYLLGPWAAAASMVLYLTLGAGGLPVFSGAAGGWAVLGGFTGGYLIALPGAALVTSWLARRGTGVARRLLAGLVGLAVIHVGGALWLAFIAPGTPESTVGLLTWSFLPFIGADLVKMLVAERVTRPAGRRSA